MLGCLVVAVAVVVVVMMVMMLTKTEAQEGVVVEGMIDALVYR